MENINKQIEDLQKKAVKYDNIKGRYVEHAQKLKNIINDLQSLMKEIDPALTLNTPRKRSKSTGDLLVIVDELHKLLIGGTQITSKFIETTYNHLNEKQISYILLRLRKDTNVKTATDGRRIRLFINKEL